MSTATPLHLETCLGALSVRDLEGICFPAPAADAADQWRRLLQLKLRVVTERLLARAVAEAPAALAPGLAATQHVVARLDAQAWLTTFTSAVAFQPLDNDTSAEGRGVPDAVAWCLALPRFLIGAPDVREMQVFFPPQVLPAAGLYLPHLHALLSPGPTGGPVAVAVGPVNLTFTWTDGNVLTLPRSREALDALRGESLPRMVLLPWLSQWPLLNGAPEVQAATARFWEAMRGPAVRAADLAAGWRSGPEEHGIFAEGLALLEHVWPEAAASAMRTARGLVFLPHKRDGHYHSYTTVKLHGAIVTTALNRVQVADVLVHEAAHTRMSPLFELDPLIQDDGQAIHPSPWRADPRPLKGLLNGVQAFMNVHHFFQRLPDLPDWPKSRTALILEEQKAKLVAGWRYLTDHTEPTPLGALMFAELDAAVKAL